MKGETVLCVCPLRRCYRHYPNSNGNKGTRRTEQAQTNCCIPEMRKDITGIRQRHGRTIKQKSALKRNPYVFDEASNETVETFYEYLETRPVDGDFWEALEKETEEYKLKPETVERLRKIREKRC